MNRIQGKKIAVIGLGISNVSVVTYLLKHDIKQLSIFDTRNNPPYAEEVPSGVDLKLGPLDPEVLACYDMLVVSPGLSIKLPAIKAALSAGRKRTKAQTTSERTSRVMKDDRIFLSILAAMR